MEDAESALRPGYRLDRYELLSPVAAGGMAQVWLARLRGKRGFEKLFAIKTIKTELIDDTRFQEMFLDEARIASGIEHPNVAQILDLGEQDDTLYLVMEWVDGESLAKIMKLSRKKNVEIPLGITLRMIADACAGLHAAHELTDAEGHNLGVVHRDVSPHNLLIAANGATKVIDFGVAKAKNRRAGETGEGVVKGKVRFMSPEQVKGKGVDRRSDIWAIGVCLHELVVGKLPFDSDNDIDVLRMIMNEEPVPPIPSSVPEAVRDILEHSLARNVDERFNTCAAMKRALETAIDRLKLEGATEDVADFVRKHFSELATKRREIVTKAVASADARPRGQASLPDQDEAFAPTVVVGSGAAKAPTSVGKTPASGTGEWRKEPTAKQRLAGITTVDATSAAFTEEVAGLPKKRSSFVWWLVALCAIGAGAWFGWPGSARIKAAVAKMTSQPTAEPAVTTPPVLSDTPSATATSSAPPIITSASASSSVVRPASTNVVVPNVPTTTTSTPTATTSTPTATATPTQTTTPPPAHEDAGEDQPY